MKSRPENKLSIHRISSLSWKTIKDKLKKVRQQPAGVKIGSNPKYMYINRHIEAFRQDHGALTEDEIIILRRQCAGAYNLLTASEKNGELLRYRRERQVVAPEEEPAPDDFDPEALDPNTHWGFGTRRCPLSADAWDRTVKEFGGGRGGLRVAAVKVFEEIDLVIGPVLKRLQIPREIRDVCSRKHPGFCRKDDSDVKDRYQAILSQLKHFESPETAGSTAYRFYDLHGCDTRDTSKDVHVWLASLRRSPRYFAVYFNGVATDRGPEHADFPFYVSDEVVRRSAIRKEAGFKSVITYTAWRLACSLARKFKGPIAMDKLTHTVTRIIKTIHVTGAERLVNDITVLLNERDDKSLPPNPDLRFMRFLSRAKPKRELPPAIDPGGEDEPWWFKKLPPRELGSDSGSGVESDQSYTRHVREIRRASKKDGKGQGKGHGKGIGPSPKPDDKPKKTMTRLGHLVSHWDF